MENSRCVQHRKQVREIFGREETDIGVAFAMLRDQMGWEFPDGKDTEITAFTRFLHDMDGEEVRKYFAE